MKKGTKKTASKNQKLWIFWNSAEIFMPKCRPSAMPLERAWQYSGQLYTALPFLVTYALSTLLLLEFCVSSISSLTQRATRKSCMQIPFKLRVTAKKVKSDSKDL